MKSASVSFMLVLVSLFNAPQISLAQQDSAGSSESRSTYLSIGSQILSDRKLYKELKLTNKQIREIRALKQKYSQEYLKAFARPSFERNPQKRVAKALKRDEKLRQLAVPFEAKLAKVLNDSQLQRVAEIHLQYCMVTRPLKLLAYDRQLSRQLKLTARQIQRLQKHNKARLIDPRQSNILTEVAAGMKTLTKEQQAKLAKLQGKKFRVRTLGVQPANFVVAMFSRMDANKDGRLTKAEAKFFWRVNQRFDKNNDEVLDKKEIQAAVAEAKKRLATYRKKFDEAIGRK